MSNLPPLTKKIAPGAAGGNEFERVMNQLVLHQADGNRYEHVPVGGRGPDGGVNGLAPHGCAPAFTGPVVFQFKWLSGELHKGDNARQIKSALAAAVDSRPDMRHWATLLLMALFACATTQPASALPLHDPPVLSGVMSGTDGPTPAQPPQGYDIPGRSPDSKVPWDFFLGNAAHRLIAYVYGVNHPESRVFYNSEPIARILLDAKLGKTSLLLPGEGNLRPDITDATLLIMFEIKPWNEAGLEDGRREVVMYLTALKSLDAEPGALRIGGRSIQCREVG